MLHFPSMQTTLSTSILSCVWNPKVCFFVVQNVMTISLCFFFLADHLFCVVRNIPYELDWNMERTNGPDGGSSFDHFFFDSSVRPF